MDAKRYVLGGIIWFVCFAHAAAGFAQSAEADPASDDPAELASADAGLADAGNAIQETVLWDIRGDNPEQISAFKVSVAESLGKADKHLLDQGQLAEHLQTLGVQPPACLRGIEECISPRATVFETLGLSSFVDVELLSVGASYRMTDIRGEAVREGEVVEADPKKLGFAVVREVLDATGVVSFKSDPVGATVDLDGRSIGTTPLVVRVEVGEHTFVIKSPSRASATGKITVRREERVSVEHKLDLAPGQLVLSGAPDAAEVYVDGQKVGNASTPIRLEPGKRVVEVKAADYESLKLELDVAPGSVIEHSAPLDRKSTLLRDVTRDKIIFNNYIIRVAGEYGYRRGTFQDARSKDDFEFVSLADDAGLLPPPGVRELKSLGMPGLRLEFAYALRNFGVSVASLSYLATGTAVTGFVAQRGEAEQAVEITNVKRLQVRPFQIFYRHVFGRFVPYIEGGIGMNFMWLKTQDLVTEETRSLRRTDALWTLSLGTQYYFTPNFFAMGRYGFQDYFDRGVGTDHQFALGIGFAFNNLFGFAPEPPDTM